MFLGLQKRPADAFICDGPSEDVREYEKEEVCYGYALKNSEK